MRRAIPSGCALLALACGCSSSQKFVAPSSSTTTVGTTRTTSAVPTSTRPAASTSTTTQPAAASTSTTPPTTPPTVPPPPKSLAALILSPPPSGFQLQPDSEADTGPTDLNKARNDDVSADAGSALVVARFVRGYQRQWMSAQVDPTTNTNDQDFIFLYQFETAAGAAEYAQHWQSALAATTPKGTKLQPFTPLFIPGAVGISIANTAVVIFSKGPYAVQAIANGGPADESGSANQLAVAQYDRLP